MPILKHDIKSILPPRRTFAKEGDEVRVISRSDHMLIVAGPDGNRFPILDADLTERLADAVDPPDWTAHQIKKRKMVAAATDEAAAPKIEPEPPKTKPEKIVPQKSITIQNSLF